MIRISFSDPLLVEGVMTIRAVNALQAIVLLDHPITPPFHDVVSVRMVLISASIRYTGAFSCNITGLRVYAKR